MTSLCAGRRNLLFSLLIVALLWLSALYAFRGGSSTDPDSSALVRPEFAGIAGINLDETELADPQLLSRLDRLAPGVRWVRFTLPWDALEPAPGRFDWTRWDALFAALAARPDLEPVVVLDRRTGLGARRAGCGYPPGAAARAPRFRRVRGRGCTRATATRCAITRCGTSRTSRRTGARGRPIRPAISAFCARPRSSSERRTPTRRSCWLRWRRRRKPAARTSAI